MLKTMGGCGHHICKTNMSHRAVSPKQLGVMMLHSQGAALQITTRSFTRPLWLLPPQQAGPSLPQRPPRSLGARAGPNLRVEPWCKGDKPLL